MDVVRRVPGGDGLVELADFVHDHRGFGGLGVGDEDGKGFAAGDVGQLVGQHVRRQVQAAPGQILFAVAESGFDHQQGHVDLVDALPEGGAAPRVAAEDEGAAGAARDGIAHGGHGVHGGQGFDGFTADVQGLAGGNFMEADEGRLWRGDDAEVGPDHVIENVGAQCCNGAGQGMNLQWRAAPSPDGIDHQGQDGNMIQMRMG